MYSGLCSNFEYLTVDEALAHIDYFAVQLTQPNLAKYLRGGWYLYNSECTQIGAQSKHYYDLIQYNRRQPAYFVTGSKMIFQSDGSAGGSVVSGSYTISTGESSSVVT